MTEPLLELQHVTICFPGRRGLALRAVDDVTLTIDRSEVLCLVGESGSGKTTTGKVAAGLLRPTSGLVRYRGRDIWRADRDTFRSFRRAVQIIHQDPYASLNPFRTVFATLAAPLEHHRLTRSRQETQRRVVELLELVDLTPAEQFLNKYPHQLSGGQRQRLSIARALTVQPELIVADEATSMVDVSIRVSLLNTLKKLRDELGVAFLFITHDLAMAKYFAWSGQIAVMYLGRLVEVAPTPRLLAEPRHPYTQALLAAIPEPDPDLTRRKAKLLLRSVDSPNLSAIPPGCSFHPRCLHFEAGLCDVQRPDLLLMEPDHFAACHIAARVFAASRHAEFDSSETRAGKSDGTLDSPVQERG
jgi:oligopeptide/dipeptide ABC transporter ATP-binding protein